MQGTAEQFCNLPQPISTFERLFRAALESLLPDLADAPWYVREHDVVNLFVFHHLIPQFQAANLDIRQIAIEVGVLKIPETEKQKHGKYADIVVWPHNKATVWGSCHPLVHIEWKNISCREERPHALKRQHAKDIRDLGQNVQYACASYAVLTEWHPFPRERREEQKDWHVEVNCKRVLGAEYSEPFYSDELPATCAEKVITELRGEVLTVLLRPMTCPDCTAATRSRAASAGSR